jgi:FtsP/CotA-like multicopper oxidase with cupredoxin domain
MTEPLSRRSALALGGIGAALVIAGGTGIVWTVATIGSSAPLRSGKELTQPTPLRSIDGLLNVALVAGPSTMMIGGTAVKAMTYNGALPGPTLIVRAGDTLAISLRNQLGAPTNLHTHGLHVSPDGSSDNVFRRIDSGGSAEYRYEIPQNHPPGVFWYHPHHHGMAADQVFGGLYGTIIVEDATPVPTARERVLVVSDMTFDSTGRIAAASQMDRMNGREGSTVLLNGQVDSTMTARPGDRERWRIVNACTSRYLDLRLDGQSLQLLGNDSGRFATPQEVTELRLLPGGRADVLVTMVAGTSTLRAIPVDRGSAGAMMGGARSSAETALASLRVSGNATPALPSLPPSVPRDLRTEQLTGRRTLTLAMGGAGMGFTIDGKNFDPGRIDQAVTAGSIEEWTIVNTSPMDHPFHLHVWPMQVIDIGGRVTDVPTWQDVVNVPARSRSRVRIAFDDFGGTAVYHCHILDHEDNGMMGVISVA